MARENTASPASSAIEMVTQTMPAIGSLVLPATGPDLGDSNGTVSPSRPARHSRQRAMLEACLRHDASSGNPIRRIRRALRRWISR